MVTTGIKSLDNILTGLRDGDNVVFQIDRIKDYKDLVTPFVKKAVEDRKNVIYMRFASHGPLVEKSKNVKIYQLDAGTGFEVFTTQVNNIITKEGVGAYYVFDCLSELLAAWATDLMIGNFFMVTCPYLFELNTIAYFSLLRDRHSFKTIARIRETTQLLLDVYHFEDNEYVHPLKVWNRYSPTMFLPHLRKGEKFEPVADSVDITQFLSHIHRKGAVSVKRNLDYWDHLFLRAEELLDSKAPKKEKEEMFQQILRIMVTKDKKIRSLAAENFTMEDLVNIKSRLIGTGLIGGKTVGMLLSRKMLMKDRALDWKNIAEEHDSFYIGSDVYYSYIVQNGWWKLRMRQKTDEGYFDAAKVLKEQMLFGTFPEEIMERFHEMIEYFGTSPIIVRSSSILEDGFGNAFAGKYDSFFCSNQGTPEQRYLKFVDAVRRIYASTMSEDALAYRKQRGLDKLDEQMALLVQRVSGAYHKRYFFPDVAGVGISYNTYVWSKDLDPKAGMVRLVFGLGTRSVNRVEGDYPRIAALDEPLLRPQAEMKDIKRFSQHDVDLIDVKDNNFSTVPLTRLLSEKLDVNIGYIGVKDVETETRMQEKGVRGDEYWVLTFDKMFSDTSFLETIKRILKTLEKKYDYPVDIEFTVNFEEDGKFKLNLLQCRPLQTKGLGRKVEIPAGINKDKVLFSSEGYFFGGNISQPIKRVIYVFPEKYNELVLTEKYDIARIIGKLNKEIKSQEETPTLLLGPGRWGTTTPSLGVPVTFSEINNVSVLGEIAFSGGNLMPELSFGTHFFQDLVETNIFYAALFPEKKEVLINEKWFSAHKNIFEKILPDSAKYKHVIGVYDVGDKGLRIMSDVLSQKVVCFFK